MKNTKIVGTVQTEAYVAMQVWDGKTTIEVRWCPETERVEIVEEPQLSKA